MSIIVKRGWRIKLSESFWDDDLKKWNSNGSVFVSRENVDNVISSNELKDCDIVPIDIYESLPAAYSMFSQKDTVIVDPSNPNL